MTADTIPLLTSQVYTDSDGNQKQTPWFEDQVDLVDRIAETGGTITNTYQRRGGEMWEIVAGERLPL